MCVQPTALTICLLPFEMSARAREYEEKKIGEPKDTRYSYMRIKSSINSIAMCMMRCRAVV